MLSHDEMVKKAVENTNKMVTVRLVNAAESLIESIRNEQQEIAACNQRIAIYRNQLKELSAKEVTEADIIGE